MQFQKAHKLEMKTRKLVFLHLSKYLNNRHS